jgi:cell division protease FtsH
VLAKEDVASIVTFLGALTDRRYAMVPGLGNVAYDAHPAGFLGPGSGPRGYSEATAREIDLSVREIFDAAYSTALAVLIANRALLEESALLLLEKETLDEHALSALFARVKATAPLPAIAAG